MGAETSRSGLGALLIGVFVVADELATGRWRDFHAADLPHQTAPRPDGSELSPHDPLLPILPTPGLAVAGAVALDWPLAELAGARAVLAIVAGALPAVCLVLPDRRRDGMATDVVLAAWMVVLVAVAAWGWRRPVAPSSR